MTDQPDTTIAAAPAVANEREAPPEHDLNSESYWSARFVGDWEDKGGPDQTRFFYRLALEHLPAWLSRTMHADQLSICDWGCATGEGTDILAQTFGVAVTGIDFARPAIEKARQLYRLPRFLDVDLLSREIDDRFDVLFCSNTLEHFEDPWPTLATVSAYAKDVLIVLVPFREYQRHPEHAVTFDLDMIPTIVADRFHLVNAHVVDTRGHKPSYWPGEQILLVYATKPTIDRCALMLGDIAAAPAQASIGSIATSIAGLADEVVGLREALATREAMQAEMLAAKTEADRATAALAAVHVAEKEALAAEVSGLRDALAMREAVQADMLAAKAESDRAAHASAALHLAEKEALAAGLAGLREALAAREAMQGDMLAVRMESERAAQTSADLHLAEKEALGAEIVGLRDALAVREAMQAELLAAKAESEQAAQASAARHGTEKEALGAEVASLRETLAAREAMQAELVGAKAERERAAEILAATHLAEKEAFNVRMTGLHEALAARDAMQSELLAARAESDRAVEASAAAHRSETDALAAEIIRFREALAVREAQIEEIYGSRSWRATASLRSATTGGRNLKQAGWASLRTAYRALPLPQRTKHRLRSAFLRGTRALPGLPPATPTHPLAAGGAASRQDGGQPDVFVWAIIDWHFRVQRPQHLARAFSQRGHRTFYFSGHFIDSLEPGFRIEPLSQDGSLQIVYLQVPGAPAIYFGMPTAQTEAAIFASLGLFLNWAAPREILSLVQHPFWSPFAERLPNRKLIYDLMDHHEGFGDNAADVIAAEHALLREADHVIVTSTFLEDIARKSNPHVSMVRNAGEYTHFSERPAEIYRDAQGRRIIGYYGAIAEWFDLDLIERIARARPNDCVLLIGADTAKAKERLGDLRNVVMTGELKYADLPFYLHAFDVCILPFKVIPLTLATNPVKVYEYLSAGKPVVSIDLPEIAQFGDCVERARTHDEFVAKVGEALAAPHDLAVEEKRRRFAAAQTWDHRVKAFSTALETTRLPRASVVVVTYNNLEFTKACLHSLDQDTAYDDVEIIVVDNASTDGSTAYLREWEKGAANRAVILNGDNLGFAAANNQGLARATGDYLVLLNNDTYVTPGWLGTLLAHLDRDPLLALVGPVTNNIGNEARIEIHYADMTQMREAALRYTSRQIGRLHRSANVAFFCVALRRETFEAIGYLDEAFGVGFFEDDDYCRRAEAMGMHVAIADDVFIHHHLSASFNALKAEQRMALFEKNKLIYESKWGPWTPHQYRQDKQ